MILLSRGFADPCCGGSVYYSGGGAGIGDPGIGLGPTGGGGVVLLPSALAGGTRPSIHLAGTLNAAELFVAAPGPAAVFCSPDPGTVFVLLRSRP